MKNTLFICLSGILLGIAGCTHETFQPVQPAPKAPSTTKSATAGVLYVNNFSTILGDTAQEDSLLSWCQAQNFYQLNLYNIGTILNSSTTRGQLNSFVAKAHGSPYFLEVSFVAAGSTTINNISSYCGNYTNDPDAVITEYEFWNAGNSYATFAAMLTALNNLKTSFPAVSRQVYLSRFEDQAGVYHTDTICRSILNNCETIFLVNYSANAYNLSGTLTNKLQQLATNAQALGKIANLSIVFNVNTGSSDPNIYGYFSTSGSNHPFVDAYDNLMTGYAASAITNKASLNIADYTIYRHSEAVTARP